MKYLVISLLVLLLTSVGAIAPYCSVNKEIGSVPIMPSQARSIDLLPIFDGFNLIYSLNDTKFAIANPVNKITSDALLQPIPASTLSLIKPLKDWNGVWQQKAALVYQSTPKSIFVSIGTSTDQKNYKFDTPPYIVIFTNDTTCFDAQYVDADHVVVNCQQDGTSSLTLVVVTASSQNIITLDGILPTKNRKLLKYLSPSGETRLLSVTPADGLSTQSHSNSFISVLKISSKYEITVENTITKGVLKRDSLKITDVVVDTQGYIYVGDSDTGIIRLQYSKSEVTSIKILSLSSGVNKLAVAKINYQQQLYIQTNSSILSYTSHLTPLNSYPFSAKLNPQNIQINQNALVLEANLTYFIYSITTGQIIQTQQFTQEQYPLIALEEASDLLLLIGKQTTLHSVSNGYLILTQPDQDLSITLTATSKNETDSATCSINIDIKAITNIEQIVQLKSFSNETTAESPVEISLKLDEYFIGSRLSYSGVPQNGVTFSNKQIEPISVPYPEFNYVKFTKPNGYITLPLNDNMYLRLTVLYDLIIIDTCTVYDQQVSVSHYDSLKVNSLILMVQLNRVKVQGKTYPMLAYVAADKPNTVVLSNLDTQEVNGYAIGPSFVTITDFKLTEQSIIVTSKSLSQFFIFTLGNSAQPALSIDLNFFTSRQVPVTIFKPDRIHYSQSRNLIYLTSVDIVLILSYSNQQLSYVNLLKMNEKIDATVNWDIVLTKTNLLAIFSDPINKIYNYRIKSTYDISLEGTLDLLGQKISSPVKSTSTDDFAFISTNDNTLTTIRINTPSLGANYHITQLDASTPLWYTATALSKFTILEVRGYDKDISSNNLFYTSPSLKINTDNHQKEFKKPYSIKINVAGIKQSNQLSTTLQVYNYQTIIQTKDQSFEKLWLPHSLNNPQDIYLDIDSFIGSVINYEIDCQYCNDSRINLVQPVSLQQAVKAEKSIDYLSFGNGVIWILRDKEIYYSKDDGETVEVVKTQATGQKLIKIDQNQALMYCQDLNFEDIHQRFVIIKAIDEKKPLEYLGFTISPELAMNNIKKTIYQNNWLYVLDNNNDGTGAGLIRIFRVSTNNDGSINSTIGEATFDYSSFGLTTKTPIQDFEIFSPDNTSARIIICTIGSGVGYASFDSDLSFNLTNPQFLQLNTHKVVQNYVLNNNKFLQLKYLYSNLKKREFTFLLSVTLGAHLQITFVLHDTDPTITKINVVNSFNKYASQSVSNVLLSTPYSATNENFFMIPYVNKTTSKTTVALYRIPQMPLQSTISLKGGVEIDSTNIDSFYFYKKDSNTTQFLISFPESESSELRAYTVTQNLKLVLNYGSPGNFDSIKLTASNAYSSATHDISLEFESKVGLKWYAIMLIALGGLVLLALIGGVWMYARKRTNDEKKISLVTEDEEV